MEAVNVSRTVSNPFTAIFSRRYTPQLVISLLIPTFQQFTGINAIIFYAPQLFATIATGGSAALLNTVIIGAVNVGSTIIGLIAVDRFGRRFLFLQGGTQALICEVVVGILVAISIGASGEGVPSEGVAKGIVALICIYIAGFAWSW